MPDFDVPLAVRLAQEITFLTRIRKPDEALRRVPRLLSTAPNWNLAHLAHAYALAALGRHEESVGACRTALGLEADHAPAHHAIANQLLALGRTEEAWEHAERAIALKPEGASYHGTRGTIARALGRADEAMASLRQAI